MLSCILNSDRAIDINILVIRIFTKMKAMHLTHKDILIELQKTENKLTAHGGDVKLIFKCLRKLLHPPQLPGSALRLNRK